MNVNDLIDNIDNLIFIPDSLKKRDKRLKNISMVYFPQSSNYGDYNSTMESVKDCRTLGFDDWRLPKQELIIDRTKDWNDCHEYEALFEHIEEFGEVGKSLHCYEYWSSVNYLDHFSVCCYEDRIGIPATYKVHHLNARRFFLVR